MSEEIIYSFQTKAGTFYISFRHGSWHVAHNRESLGSYQKPEQASKALATGETEYLPPVLNPEMLGISANIDDWEWEWMR